MAPVHLAGNVLQESRPLGFAPPSLREPGPLTRLEAISRRLDGMSPGAENDYAGAFARCLKRSSPRVKPANTETFCAP